MASPTLLAELFDQEARSRGDYAEGQLGIRASPT